MKRKHVEEDEDVGEAVSTKFIGPQRPSPPKENPFSMKKPSPTLPSPRPALGEKKGNNFHEKHASAAAPVNFYGNGSPKKPRKVDRMKGKGGNNPNYPNKKSKHSGYQPKVIKDRRR